MAQKAKIWEGVIRINHWLLTIAIIGLFVSAELNMFSRHVQIGKFVLALVIFRILWGLVGSQPARFKAGFCSLFRIPAYSKTLFRRRPEYTTGHTPLGWLMVFALLMAVGGQALLGLSMEKNVNGHVHSHQLSPLFKSGELKEMFNFIHTDIMPKIIIALIVIHILAILWYLWGKKQNLIPAMITGNKMVNNPPQTNFKKFIIPAVLTAAVAIATTWVIINLAKILGLS
ncbi:MAG: cytochrome b/b6 domain-containing protein [Alphaproteobacteria bacterium]